MKSILPEICLVYSIFLLSAQGGEPGFNVSYFPEAAYRNEQASFVLEGRPGSRINVSFDGRLLAEPSFTEKRLEVNLFLVGSGSLVFSQETATVTFRVVQPADGAALQEKDGYLYSDNVPVVLLAVHTCPPKHDRRWEIVKAVRKMFSDVRPSVSSGVLAGASFLAENEKGNLDSLTGAPAGFWTYAGLSNGLSEINGLISGAPGLKRTGMAVIALTASDHERGIDDVQFRIKMEWYLQALKESGFRHVFLLPPPFDSRQAARFPDLTDQLKEIARGNNARLANIGRAGDKEVPSAASWLKPAMKEIQKVVKCE